ncbi:hypothetical protein PHJA_001401200 [Phtheirospermum japonicum]|uniref:KIB1-4 beta-propeller domain-containing protein n=1 Tax=Phtheirospermum japonicum TaxID=374723 RepID=A0A830BYM5_9LAMI|nr:hypothetical protein PHJA_001401200 [Phtheirospermum japonicum]
MFIGLNHSFALPAAEYPGLIPNSIYFTDVLRDNTPLKRWVDSIYGCHDVGIFNYENRTFSPCYYPRDFQSIKKIKPPPIWFTSSPH